MRNDFLMRTIALYLLLIFNLSAQEVISQSPELVKSVLNQVGSSTVSFEYLDNSGVLKTTKVQQSIGQQGVVGLSKISSSSVQQGFLNYLKTIMVDNPDSEFVETYDLFVFPNPFKTHVNVKFSKLTDYPVHIEIFDIRGRLVLDQEFQPSRLITVPTERLEDASYLIRVSSGSQEYLKKIIKGIN